MKEIQKKGSISKQIEDELKKREKYYFGFIPASMINQTTIMITISLLFLTSITCCKYYRKVQEAGDRKSKFRRTNNE